MKMSLSVFRVQLYTDNARRAKWSVDRIVLNCFPGRIIISPLFLYYQGATHQYDQNPRKHRRGIQVYAHEQISIGSAGAAEIVRVDDIFVSTSMSQVASISADGTFTSLSIDVYKSQSSPGPKSHV